MPVSFASTESFNREPNPRGKSGPAVIYNPGRGFALVYTIKLPRYRTPPDTFRMKFSNGRRRRRFAVLPFRRPFLIGARGEGDCLLPIEGAEEDEKGER